MPRFVILEHSWNGVHFDLLVETHQSDALLRTWAIDVPAFPNFTPGLALPARELPAHRRVYLDYEGPISGGRGEVTRWDEGTCEILHWSESSVRLNLSGRQLEGEVEVFAFVDGISSASMAGGGSKSWVFRFGKLR